MNEIRKYFLLWSTGVRHREQMFTYPSNKTTHISINLRL